jgi:hypothetical protein
MSLSLIFELSWPTFGRLYVNFVLECTHLNVRNGCAVADHWRSLNDRRTIPALQVCILRMSALFQFLTLIPC